MIAERLQTERTEREPQPKNPALILGGGHGTGAEIAKILSSQGRTVYVGTRSTEHYQDVLRATKNNGGKRPEPFIADITLPTEFQLAYAKSGIRDGQAIDFYALAAEGFEPIKLSIGLPIFRLQRVIDKGGDIRLAAESETEKLKQKMTTENALKEAKATNAEAPLNIANFLIKHGNLDSTSKIVVLDSTISKYAQDCVQDPDKYPGPWFYYPIGITKARGSLALRGLAKELDATFFDGIAPGITDTEAGKFIELFRPVFNALDPQGEGYDFPNPSAAEVAKLLVGQMAKDWGGKRAIDLYVGYEPGVISTQIPINFKVPILPYL